MSSALLLYALFQSQKKNILKHFYNFNRNRSLKWLNKKKKKSQCWIDHKMSRFSSFFWYCHLYTHIFLNLWKRFREEKGMQFLWKIEFLFCVRVRLCVSFFTVTQWKWNSELACDFTSEGENIEVTKPICFEHLYNNNNRHKSTRKGKMDFVVCTNYTYTYYIKFK